MGFFLKLQHSHDTRCIQKRTIGKMRTVKASFKLSIFHPPLSGDKGGAKTPTRQLPPARPCVSPLTPPRLRRHRFDDSALRGRQGLPLHPPWRATHQASHFLPQYNGGLDVRAEVFFSE